MQTRIVKEAIASYIALEDERHRMTLDALADVDEKRTLEHAEVEAWADGLDKPKRARRR
jgi:predicted transcriptional regulator